MVVAGNGASHAQKLLDHLNLLGFCLVQQPYGKFSKGRFMNKM